MNRALLIAVLLLAGCAKQPSVEEIEPFIAVAGTYSLMAAEPPPAPPKPVAGDACPSCYGRGFVGDGVAKTQCQTCKGTGKVVTHPPVMLHDCKDGKCPKTKSTAR
jgi:hypothetical protein